MARSLVAMTCLGGAAASAIPLARTGAGAQAWRSLLELYVRLGGQVCAATAGSGR